MWLTEFQGSFLSIGSAFVDLRWALWPRRLPGFRGRSDPAGSVLVAAIVVAVAQAIVRFARTVSCPAVAQSQPSVALRSQRPVAGASMTPKWGNALPSG
jgi:hypothetical protein